jgi:hypothetical protein
VMADTGHTVGFRPMTEADLPMVAGWLRAP